MSSRDVSDVVHNLYDARPHLCKTDGRRFQVKRKLEEHLDDLFIKNKSKKERTGIQERLWFRQVDEWCKAQDVASVTDKTNATSDTTQVEAAEAVEEEKYVVVCNEWGSGLKCGACHEVLKKSWDGDSDEWVFRGVICLESSSTGRPSLVHQICHRASTLHST